MTGLPESHDCTTSLFTLLIKKWTENWLENSLSLGLVLIGNVQINFDVSQHFVLTFFYTRLS